MTVCVRLKWDKPPLFRVKDFHALKLEQIKAPEDSLGCALDLIKDQNQNPVIAHFLSRVIIVKDWDSVLKHREWAKDHNCTLVTLDGQWIDASGIIRGGSEETRTLVDLGLRKQVQETKDLLSRTEEDQNTTTVQIRESRGQRSSIEQKLIEVQRKLKQINLNIVKLREEEVKQETLIASLARRTEAASTQITDLNRQIEETTQKIESSQSVAEKVKAELMEAESSGGDLSERFAEARTVVAKSRDRRHESEIFRDAVKHKVDLVEARFEPYRSNAIRDY